MSATIHTFFGRAIGPMDLLICAETFCSISLLTDAEFAAQKAQILNA